MKRLSHYTCQWLLLVCGLTASISASATGRDEVVFYFNDALGSAVAAVSESGNLCWSEVYSGYGEKTIDSDYGLNGVGCGVLGQERGYTGHTQDWETDLVYMQQRYYDASIGRFLSIDPIDTNPGQPQTYNRYAYGNNNPYRYTDPTGEIPFDTIFDAVSVVYDLGKIGVGYSTGNSALVSEGVIDLTGDIGALLTPYVPAGGTKVARALAKADSKVPNSATARGRASEARVLDDLGLPKNNKKVTTGEGNSIPDALTDRQSIEIKDTICVSCTKQVRIQTDAARKAGRESVLITGTGTRVSGPANRAFDRVIRRDDLGPQ